MRPSSVLLLLSPFPSLLLSCHMYFLTLSFGPLPTLLMTYHDDHKRVYMEASLWMLIWNFSYMHRNVIAGS